MNANAPRAVYQQDQATSLLQHYMRTVFEKAGLPWDSDSDVEVAGIVECIVEAAVAKAAEERRVAIGA